MQTLFKYISGEEKRKNIKCFNCRHFAFWDWDPVCVYEMTLILPIGHDDCKHYCPWKHNSLSRYNDILETWYKLKRKYFEIYTIENCLKNKYLEYFPEDVNLITEEK